MIDTQAIKNKILNLAMRGQLTEQLPGEGDAEELYAQIQEEKARLIKEGRIKKAKSLGEINDEDSLFDITSNWKWIRVGDVAEIAGGTTPKNNEISNSGTIPYFKVSDMNTSGNETRMIYAVNYISDGYQGKIFPEGTTIFPKNGGAALTNKRRLLVTPSAVDLNTGGCIPVIYDMVDWIRLYMDTVDFGKMDTGANIPTVNASNLKKQPFPLPPLSEQKRIVHQISKAMEILETIEELQSQYASNQESLKSKLIDAAIQGKLTEQLPEDGTAEDLRKEAIQYKEELAKEGILKNRKNKDLRDITDEERLFDIPSSWRWFRLGEIIEVFGRIGFRGYKKSDLVKKGQGAITMSPSNISKSGEVSFDSSTYISWEKYEESPEIMLEEGDIVLVKTGSTYGKCGIINKLPEKATINPQLAILKYIKCNRKYLYYVLRSTAAWTQYENFVVGAATPTFSQEKLSNMMIPIPPMAEQKRIVNTLDQVFEDR